MRRDLNCRSSELICWLTADWVTSLIWAALVKLSVSARSQKTLRDSICIRRWNTREGYFSQLMFRQERWFGSKLASEHVLRFLPPPKPLHSLPHPGPLPIGWGEG